MTISTTNSRVEYTGAGTTGPFSFPYYFLEDDDLVVIKREIATGIQTTLTLTTDYTVSGAGVPAGGSVSTVASVSSAYEIIIFRDPDILQGTEYPEGDRFPSASHERALDKLTMVAQRLKDLILRSFHLTDGDTTGGTMEIPVDRAGKYVAFDANGNLVAVSGTTSDIVVSSFMETVLDDANASAALTTLGVTAFIKTLLDDANAAAARTTLGLVIGTDVQAYNATLAALAAQTEAANKIQYYTADDTPGLLDFKDEDNMASDSATAVPSQQSVKAHVAAQVLTRTTITLGTEQTSTSGASIDFTGIPAGAKRITVMFKAVSTSGTSPLLLQLGDAGGIESSGYLSSAGDYGSAATSTAGLLLINAAVAAETYSGAITLSLENAAAFSWVSQGVLASTLVNSSGGSKSLSAELTQLRITTVGGTDTFDAGAVNISYE